MLDIIKINKMNTICYLCGKEIVEENPSSDHSIPKQFIKREQPKTQGFDYGGKLPTHAKCNNQFGPEKICPKALQILGIYEEQIYTNINNPNISIQVFLEEKLNSFSKEDLEFFGFIDVRNVQYENWAHNPDFFKNKKKIIPLEKSLNAALSVLVKSAAALLIKRFQVPPSSSWNILCMPYQAQNSTDIDSIFGNTKPFEIDLKVWIKKCDNDADYFVAYKNEQVFLLTIFSFSHDEKYLKYCLQTFHNVEKLLFKGSSLVDLITYDWLKNRIV